MLLARLSIALIVFLPASALADVVILTDGERIEGVVRDRGKQIEVQLDFGTVSVDKSEVKEIKRSASPLRQLEKRRSEINGRDVKALFELARWARDKRLATQARSLCREVLQIDPNHKGAHLMLGHKKHDGTWMTEDEYQAATGHVRYRGRWVKAEEAARLQREDDARRREAAQRAQLAELENKVDRAEREAAEAKSAAERAQREAEDAKNQSWWQGGAWGYWSAGRFYPNPYKGIAGKSKHTPRKITPSTSGRSKAIRGNGAAGKPAGGRAGAASKR